MDKHSEEHKKINGVVSSNWLCSSVKPKPEACKAGLADLNARDRPTPHQLDFFADEIISVEISFLLDT